MKLMKRLLPLMLALALPLCTLAEDDSRRWVEDITKMTRVPTINAERIDPDFARIAIGHSGDVASAVLAWAGTDILHGGIYESLAGDLSLFVMRDGAIWRVSLTHADSTAVLTLDAQGRLLRYISEHDGAYPAYDGYLPEGTDEAVLSYIGHFARMNGYTSVTGYERIGCTAADEAYDVRVTAQALLDGMPCTFTLSLATMAFTELDCQPPMLHPTATPAPVSAEPQPFTVTLEGEALTVYAIDKLGLGHSFSPWPEDALPREEVFAIALQALTEHFGVTAADVTAEPFEYGYDMESSVAHWQLDFACPAYGQEGTIYTVHVRDSDGAVLGVWGPEEANG